MKNLTVGLKTIPSVGEWSEPWQLFFENNATDIAPHEQFQ